jgi:alpha-beta hydrolase superfamily lysophospholipase
METTSIEIFNDHKIAIALLDAGGKDIVIFCHGFRSDSSGPNRFFVNASRLLAEQGISSLRFDQFGSGNSEGEFIESSFNDWVATTAAIGKNYLEKGFRVCLFGQSMGSAAALKAASNMPGLSAVVAWVPDPNVEDFNWPKSGVLEEAGQIVQASYWQEAHDAHIASAVGKITAPTYIVQCSDDEYVSPENHEAIVQAARSDQTIEMLEGHKHSAWTAEQAASVIAKSVDFIVAALHNSQSASTANS